MFDVAFRFCYLLTLLRWAFSGMRGSKKATLPKISHINDAFWHSYTLPTEDAKTI